MAQPIDAENPESKTKDVIKFYFKDVLAERNICELEVDKNQYDMAFIANDKFPLNTIVVVLTINSGEKKTPRLLKFKHNEDDSWEIASDNGEL